MKKKRRNGGFTLAELLIVVAIIGVLSGVAFVAVQSHERAMTQLELDTVAKEIFMAAQNHLTVAKSLGYNGSSESDYGEEGTYTEDLSKDGKCIVYYVDESCFTTEGNSLLDQMLPFGAIDDTVRLGGKYIIRYQPGAGVVLDVFYWKDKSESPAYDDLMADASLRVVENKEYRASYTPMIGWFGGVDVVPVGDYLETPSIKVSNAEKLVVQVTDTNLENADKKLKNPMLKLIIEGETSKARLAFTLTSVDNGGSTYAVVKDINNPTRLQSVEVKTEGGKTGTVFEIVLDDITAKDMRFAQLNQLTPTIGDDKKGRPFPESDSSMEHTWDPDTFVSGKPKQFIPGEDITIQAVAYSNTEPASVAYSGKWTTNSLFGGLRANVALISNIRHLENLDEKVSDVAYSNTDLFGARFSAEQTANLDWNDFKGKTTKEGTNGSDVLPSVYSYKDGSGAEGTYITKPGCYMPVSPGYALTYSGQSEIKNNTSGEVRKVNHSAAKITVDDTGDYTPPTGVDKAEIPAAGMFGSLIAGSEVSDLELVDFSITTGYEKKDGETVTERGSAGALAGTIADATVANVVAYNSTGATAVNITASGASGGLIGAMSQTSGTCKVEKSAAALIVSSTGGDAGGLIGAASGGTVSACYSGGHTSGGAYVTTGTPAYNVTAGTNAGGLIGAAGAANIDHSYSTCSATGSAAGGFVGTASGSISYCYATGLVKGTGTEKHTIDSVETDVNKEGAFAFSATGTVANSYYYEIINERAVTETTGEGDSAATKTVGYRYLPAVGVTASNPEGACDGAKPLDAYDDATKTYAPFLPEQAAWKDAIPYDGDTWKWYYKGARAGIDAEGKPTTENVAGYSLNTVAQLRKKETAADSAVQEEEKTVGKVTTPADYVATHYGDWPAPEIFVVNTPTSQSSG